MSAIHDQLAQGLGCASDIFGVSQASILSNCRPEHVLKARFTVYAWLRYCGHPHTAIMRAMQKKHHGAILSGLSTLRCWFETLPSMRAKVYEFTKAMGIELNQFVTTVWPTKKTS